MKPADSHYDRGTRGGQVTPFLLFESSAYRAPLPVNKVDTVLKRICTSNENDKFLM